MSTLIEYKLAPLAIGMSHRYLLLLLFLAVGSLPLAPSQAKGSADVRVTTTSHCAKLTLIVPRRVHPRNAIIRATVVLTKVSTRTLLLSGNNPPTIFVTDSGGNAVYIPSRPLRDKSPALAGPGPRPPIPLQPSVAIDVAGP